MGKGIRDLINEVKSLNQNSELAAEGNALVLHNMADSLESNTTVFAKIANAVQKIEDTLAGNALADREAAFEARNKKKDTASGLTSSSLATPSASVGVLGGMLGGLGLSGGVTGLIETILGYKLFKSIFGFFSKFPAKIMTMFKATVARLIPFLATPIGWVVMGAAILGFTAWAYWEEVSEYASTKWGELSNFAKNQLNNVAGIFSETWTNLKGTWTDAMTGISSWISDKTAPLFDAWDNAWAKFNDFTDIMSNGITETQKWLEAKWVEYSSKVKEYFRNLFGFEDSNAAATALVPQGLLPMSQLNPAPKVLNPIVDQLLDNVLQQELLRQDIEDAKRRQAEHQAAKEKSWKVTPLDPKTGEPLRPQDAPITVSGSNNTDNSSITVNNYGTQTYKTGPSGINYGN